MGCLTTSTFEALLCLIIAKNTVTQLARVVRQQLHQALAWLKPAPGSQQMEAWSSLRSRLQAVVPEPAIAQLYSPGQTELWATLTLQSMAYKAQGLYGVYRADAVLSSSSSDGAEVLLLLRTSLQMCPAGNPPRYAGSSCLSAKHSLD